MTLAELERWSLERAWVAASALYYQVPVITNNGRDYSMVDGFVLI
jgi:predicted nucleic acid-binding protein